MMFPIAGSIVLYNNKIETVQKTINCFLNTELSIKLYIVDNSADDKKCTISKDERIEYIFNGKNVGFGAGHNIAIKKSLNDSKYHLILNPDIFFENGVLEKLYTFMEANNRVGLVMPKICYFDGSNQYLCKLLPTPIDLIGRRLNSRILKILLKNRFDRYELKFTGYDKIMDVPHLSGCFMFIRSEVFKKIGCFDEIFFMYLDDIDLSRRIHRYYRTVYYPEATIYHKHKRGSYKNSKLLKHHILAAVRYFNKWGWVFDRERARVNKAALAVLNAQPTAASKVSS